MRFETIVAVVPDDKYARVISGSTEFFDHRTLRDWEELLRAFERIDRSTVINDYGARWVPATE
jgi:hypothetical protein